MDFDDTPEEVAFRNEVRAWLDAHAPLRATSRAATAPGAATATGKDGSAGGGGARSAADPRRRRRGPGCPRGGLSPLATDALRQRVGRDHLAEGVRGAGRLRHGADHLRPGAGTLRDLGGALSIGLAMVGPTLMVWGTPEQQDRFIEPMLRGDEMWCQLFSEPGAGSDLPSLITRAEHDGDVYVVFFCFTPCKNRNDDLYGRYNQKMKRGPADKASGRGEKFCLNKLPKFVFYVKWAGAARGKCRCLNASCLLRERLSP